MGGQTLLLPQWTFRKFHGKDKVRQRVKKSKRVSSDCILFILSGGLNESYAGYIPAVHTK